MTSAVEKLGSRLLEARLRVSGLRGGVVPQVEVARAVGVTGMTYGRWEKGELEPTLAILEKLAAYYGVRAEWLAFGRGAMLDPEAPALPIDPAGRRPGPSIVLPDRDEGERRIGAAESRLAKGD